MSDTKLEWPWDEFPEDLSTWKVCVREYQTLEAELAEVEKYIDVIEEGSIADASEIGKLCEELAEKDKRIAELKEALRRIIGWRETDLAAGSKAARIIEYVEGVARIALSQPDNFKQKDEG